MVQHQNRPEIFTDREHKEKERETDKDKDRERDKAEQRRDLGKMGEGKYVEDDKAEKFKR